MKPGIQKGKWNDAEDQILRDAVTEHGTKWTIIATKLPHRTPAQCRERWCFHLSPELNKSRFTEEEDNMIMDLHEKYGNKWSKITAELNTNRSEASVRARYHSLVRDRNDFSPDSSPKDGSEYDMSKQEPFLNRRLANVAAMHQMPHPSLGGFPMAPPPFSFYPPVMYNKEFMQYQQQFMQQSPTNIPMYFPFPYSPNMTMQNNSISS